MSKVPHRPDWVLRVATVAGIVSGMLWFALAYESGSVGEWRRAFVIGVLVFLLVFVMGERAEH